MSYVIGLDYGTDSVPAILVNCVNGEVVGNSVYTHTRWEKEQFLYIRDIHPNLI